MLVRRPVLERTHRLQPMMSGWGRRPGPLPIRTSRKSYCVQQRSEAAFCSNAPWKYSAAETVPSWIRWFDSLHPLHDFLRHSTILCDLARF